MENKPFIFGAATSGVSIVRRALIKKELIEIEKRQVMIPNPVMKV